MASRFSGMDSLLFFGSKLIFHVAVMSFAFSTATTIIHQNPNLEP
jgi:hypothetical protein